YIYRKQLKLLLRIWLEFHSLSPSFIYKYYIIFLLFSQVIGQPHVWNEQINFLDISPSSEFFIEIRYMMSLHRLM
ncbi:MAG: hypothetical protein WHS77_09345, partial [Brevinematales bacterium]